MELLLDFWWILIIILFVVGYKFVLRFFGILIIPNDTIGIVNKRFVIFGMHRTLPDGAIIALRGEAGYQADTLAPGLHFWLWPWQYNIGLQSFRTIKEGFVGIVEAKDGHPLANGRVLAKRVVCDSFQNARAFLANGGERGPQITVIPPGTYRINTALFSIADEKVLEIEDNKVGVVTTKEGKPLAKDEIAGKEVPGHNMFQDAQTFIDNGGFKGLQEQVMLAGRYFINPRFATVETMDMTTVPIANVGVVIAYVGSIGVDVTGDPFTHKVEIVPTANVVLNWATGKTEAHKLDEKLSTITVRSSDGFKFNLDVSQIIHIPRTDAPKVIARFGSVANLVTQVLEPTIGNYFRNAAQSSDVIDFLKQRKERQEDARASISKALQDYNVGAVDTLIGDIVPPEDLMKTLTDRKLAEQEKVTYQTQREAEGVRKDLQQAKALADTQARVVDAERMVQINEFEAQAAVKKAEGEAKSKTVNADADAMVLKTVGAAEGEKIKAVGISEADVIKLKIQSMESGNYAAIEVARNLAGSGQKLVPEIVAGGSAGGDGSNSLVNMLLAMVIKDKLSSEPQASMKK
jgi:uncharacterized membrane protein YqiK